MFRSLRELWEYRSVLAELITLGLRSKYRRAYLGIFWTILAPLAQVFVMWQVFSRITREELPVYPLFMLSGLLAFRFFQRSVTSGTAVIIGNKNLYTQVYVPTLVFPVALVMSNVVDLTISFGIYLVLAGLFYEITWTAALVPVALFLVILITLGAVSIAATINVFVRDLSQIIGVAIRMLFYLTPIFYSPKLVGDAFMNLIQFNPMTPPVLLVRDLLYYHSPGSPELWWKTGMWAALLSTTGLFLFTKLQKRFVYYV